MARYECSVCGYVYDESKEGTLWGDLPEGWVCPICGSPKSGFRRVGSGESERAARFSHRLIQGHRIFGYLFAVLYLFFVWQMVPRLWSYQIEFPARTTAHITLGIAIGAMLILKILIVRFFRRLDATLAPALGASLFVATAVLIGLSAPFAFQGAIMERASAASGIFAEENLQRIRTLLAQAGLDDAEREQFSRPGSLRAGRNVLRKQCVECHDLRTVLAKPRTPEDWRRTVRRMADRAMLWKPLEETEQLQVTAYLIAISPQLQRAARKLRSREEESERAREAVEKAAAANGQTTAFDVEQARRLFETKCSECHEPSLVETAPPASRDDARSLVAQMVDEGLTASEEELGQITEYLVRTYGAAPKP